ncbi:MAG TPA: hypothetical protein VGA04_31400 [Streptosporangiaceae bacterium]
MYDDFEPTSEVYRLMPPRCRESELREALAAAHGVTKPGSGLDAGEPAPRRWRPSVLAGIRRASRRAALWLGGVITLTVAGVLTLAVWALINRW